MSTTSKRRRQAVNFGWALSNAEKVVVEVEEPSSGPEFELVAFTSKRHDFTKKKRCDVDVVAAITIRLPLFTINDGAVVIVHTTPLLHVHADNNTPHALDVLLSLVVDK
jgi:hypothetical protein